MPVSPDVSPPVHGRLWTTFVRFLLSGAFNTAATYALYLVLIRFISYRAAYTTAFVSGIVLSYCLNRVFVFRAKGGIGTAALFPLVYLAQYLAGLGVVSLWVETLGWSASLAPAAAIAVTVPLTFIMTKWVFTGKGLFRG